MLTNFRPDIVWWSDEKRELWLFELTVSYETKVEDARSRKKANLVVAGKATGLQRERER